MAVGNVTDRWVKTSDGKEMQVWIITPPHFDPNKKYPTLLFCEGGPQSPVSQFWSYRWNFRIMAANGYVVVAPNRRGLPGYGSKWNEEISGDWTGQCMRDYRLPSTMLPTTSRLLTKTVSVPSAPLSAVSPSITLPATTTNDSSALSPTTVPSI